MIEGDFAGPSGNDGTPWINRRMCAVCHKRLNRRMAPDGTTVYQHGYGVQDHDPAPVMEPEEQDVILVCDFCLDPHPTWDFGCSNFVDEGSLTGNIEVDIGVALGDWAACDKCKDLIVTNNWERLADRSVQGQINHNPEAAVAYAASPAIMYVNRLGMMDLHQQFNKARTGPPTPISQATWIASKLREVIGEEQEQ